MKLWNAVRQAMLVKMTSKSEAIRKFKISRTLLEADAFKEINQAIS